MNIFLITLALIASICVVYGKNLDTKTTKTSTLKTTFTLNHDLPKTVDDALAANWVQVSRPADPLMPGLDMYCPKDDPTVCVLYLVTGYVAGIQISVRVAGFTDTIPSDLSEIGFRKWVPPIGNDDQEEYWYTAQYFISQSSLMHKSEAELRILTRNNDILYDEGVWVPDFSGDNFNLMCIPERQHATTTPFTVQACIPAMGRHYYYNMTRTTSCDHLYPWFTLFDEGQLIGTGFMIIGNLYERNSTLTEWFEAPESFAVRMIVPNGPECLYNLTDAPGVTTLHIYYIDSPSTLGCVEQ